MPYKDKGKAKAAKKAWDDKNRVGKRHSVWLAIFYPQDVPGWEQDMEEGGVPCLVSPLHDKDLWTEHDEAKFGKKAGTPKVAHRHIIAVYESPVSYEQFRQDFAYLARDGKGPSKCKYAQSLAASTLYLAHESKECERQGKHRYDPTLIREFCGANYMDWKARIEDVHGQMKVMRAFIRDNNITEFNEFQDWCDVHNDDWSRLLDLKCAWAIGNYIDRQRKRAEAERKALRAARDAADAAERRKQFEDSHPSAGGLTATPPQGESEPRTPNPGCLPADLENGESRVSEPEPPVPTPTGPPENPPENAKEARDYEGQTDEDWDAGWSVDEETGPYYER